MDKWLATALKTIKDGIADRLEKDNIIVYKVGKIIRIDIKNVFEQ